jgi:hypothetical protein
LGLEEDRNLLLNPEKEMNPEEASGSFSFSLSRNETRGFDKSRKEERRKEKGERRKRKENGEASEYLFGSSSHSFRCHLRVL